MVELLAEEVKWPTGRREGPLLRRGTEPPAEFKRGWPDPDKQIKQQQQVLWRSSVASDLR